jgi:DNA-binding SARP family transcriptional activator/predicted ATPase
MFELKICLLGPFSATYKDKPLQNFKTVKVQALFIFLAMERDYAHRRESLMELLWPDMPLESSQVNLRQTIYRLRQTFQDLCSDDDLGKYPVLLSDRHTVRFNPEIKIQTDVDTFKAGIIEDPTSTIEHYRGDFLTDFYLIDSNPFESWSESIREQLRRIALDTLNKLTKQAIDMGDYTSAQNYAWRQLEIDHFRENAYRQLMIALAQSGQRNAALAQFQICERRLNEGLGIDPSQETLDIYEKIQADVLRKTKTPDSKQISSSIGTMPIFLLTDIESSTQLWDTHHQAMLPALFQHNSILEDQITKHGGRILELRGDGVKAVFENVNPLRCMIDIQKSLSEADWGDVGNLKIRIGLHGVPSVRKGYDYFEKNDAYYGPVLNHTARIMDAGWGGQILVSEQVRNTCSLPDNASWQDFGLHNVKNLDHPIHIFGLLHPNLPYKSFPPIRTLTSQRVTKSPDTTFFHHNIPPQPKSFIGRQKELSALKNLLGDPRNKLISIVGPGGIGKTHLAIAFATNTIETCQDPKETCIYPDGVFFIPLAAIDNPEQIIPTIAKELKIPTESSPSPETLEKVTETSATPIENLTSFLQSKGMLVLLDNFEHLIEGAEIISELLAIGTSTKFLVTSRERLNIREEQIFPIQGLEFPDWEAPEDPCEYTAMELFIHSARRVQPEFTLEPGDMIYLTRICSLVEGMPLGLELAASWVDTLSLEDITLEIQAGLDFLETDVRNIPDRHRSIRAVFESSWSRLSESEKQILPRLSVFRDNFSRDAANEVAKASLRNLASFVSKSLIQFDQETNHYHIHELLRQYGIEQLIKTLQDESETRNRHSSYYCHQIERNLQQMMVGNTQMQSAIETMGSLANIQLAWDWAVKHRNIENVKKAITGICLFYNWYMRIEEGLKTCDQALEMLDKLTTSEGTPQEIDQYILTKRLYARILSWKGYFNIHFDHNLARMYLDQAMIIINEMAKESIDAPTEHIWILYFQSLLDFLTGEMEDAREKLHKSLSLSRREKLHFWVFRCLGMLGDVARNSGLPREAKHWYSQSLEESRAKNNRWGEINALNALGWAARKMMAYDEAEHYYEESYDLSKENNDQYAMINAMLSLGWLSLFLGKLDTAVTKLSEAEKLSKEVGTPHQIPSAQVNLGITYWLSGDFSRAEEMIGKSIALTREMSPGIRLFPNVCMAEYYTLLGRYTEANDQIQTLKVWTRDIFVDSFINARFLRVLGLIALVKKDYKTAAVHFNNSIVASQTQSDDEQIAWSQAGLARALMGQGKWDEAHQTLTEALWTTIEIRGFIPLVFTLPMVVLYLSKEDPEMAKQVLKQIQVSPFIANAQFFDDVVFKFLPDMVMVSNGQENVLKPNEILWETAASVLSRWIHVWMEEQVVE